MSGCPCYQFLVIQYYDNVFIDSVHDSLDLSIFLLLSWWFKIRLFRYRRKFFIIVDLWKHWDSKKINKVKTFEFFVWDFKHCSAFVNVHSPTSWSSCLPLHCNLAFFIKNGLFLERWPRKQYQLFQREQRIFQEFFRNCCTFCLFKLSLSKFICWIFDLKSLEGKILYKLAFFTNFRGFGNLRFSIDTDSECKIVYF